MSSIGISFGTGDPYDNDRGPIANDASNVVNNGLFRPVLKSQASSGKAWLMINSKDGLAAMGNAKMYIPRVVDDSYYRSVFRTVSSQPDQFYPINTAVLELKLAVTDPRGVSQGSVRYNPIGDCTFVERRLVGPSITYDKLPQVFRDLVDFYKSANRGFVSADQRDLIGEAKRNGF